MEISRREFLKLAAAAAAALGLSGCGGDRLERILTSKTSPPVLWLNGAGCSGCSMSLLNAVNPTIDHLLQEDVKLEYHSSLMAASGDLAVASARSVSSGKDFILVVEGAVPTANEGKFCYVWEEGGRAVTMMEAVRSLAQDAKQVVAVGTCGAFGGMAAANPQTSAKGVGAFLNRSVVNVPGCPAHPDWIVGTLSQLLVGDTPKLDGYSRPIDYYPREAIHQRCPREDRHEDGAFGQGDGCLERLGCKGHNAHADCERRLWNNKQNWCIGANGLCIACTEPSFPAFPLHGTGRGSRGEREGEGERRRDNGAPGAERDREGEGDDD